MRLSQWEIAVWQVWDSVFYPLYDPWLHMAVDATLTHNANTKKPVCSDHYYMPARLAPKQPVKSARTRIARLRQAGINPKVVRFKKEPTDPK